MRHLHRGLATVNVAHMIQQIWETVAEVTLADRFKFIEIKTQPISLALYHLASAVVPNILQFTLESLITRNGLLRMCGQTHIEFFKNFAFIIQKEKKYSLYNFIIRGFGVNFIWKYIQNI